MTNEQKQKVVDAVKNDCKKFNKQAEHARKLGISEAAYSSVFSAGKISSMSEKQWHEIAYILKVNLKSSIAWKQASTPTFDMIYSQLRKCQAENMSLVFCDNAGIGKTYTAERYAEDNREVALIDCSIHKTKRRFVFKIAQELGVPTTGHYTAVLDRLIYHINNIKEQPLIILDEAGDLASEAFLEIKSLWNATKENCGWYMMGAIGLKRRIEMGKSSEKVGYEEIFDRYGAKYQSVTQDERWAGDINKFNALQIALVAKANVPGLSLQVVIAKADNSLRNVEKEVKKLIEH